LAKQNLPRGGVRRAYELSHEKESNLFWRCSNKSGASSDRRQDGFIKSLLPASSLLSIAVLMLIAPDFYHHTKDFVFGFLALRYPLQLLPIALFALCAIAYLSLFTEYGLEHARPLHLRTKTSDISDYANKYLETFELAALTYDSAR